ARLHVDHDLGSGAVGWPGYSLALIGVVAGGRIARGWPRRLGLALAVGGVLASLGPGVWTAYGTLWSPYALLAAVVPGLASIRMPARFVMIPQLGLSLLAGVGVARLLLRRSAPASWLLVA